MDRNQPVPVHKPLDHAARPAHNAGIHRNRATVAGFFGRELSITGAAVLLATAFILSTGLGVIRQVLLNTYFGYSAEANAYYAAYRLPDMLFKVVAGGALSNAMIPIMVGVAQHEGDEAESRLTNLVLTTLLAFFAVVILIVEIWMPAFVGYILAPGFDDFTAALTVKLARIMMLQPLILAAGSVAIAVLNSRNRFVLTGLSIVSNNIALILGILAARMYPDLGIYGPTFGVLGGALLQVLILTPGLRARGFRYRPAWDLKDPPLRAVIRLLIPNSLSVGVGYAGGIVETALASKAPEAAGLAAIYNANLLFSLPVRLFGHAFGQAAFPRLAAYSAADEWPLMRRTLTRTLLLVVGLAIPAMIGLIFLGRPTIRILLEHGEFDSIAGTLTYAVLVPHALALPAYIATEVLTRGLLALKDTTTPLATNTAQLIGRTLLTILLLPTWGVVAIPIGLAVSSTVETLVLALILWWKLRRAGTPDRATA